MPLPSAHLPVNTSVPMASTRFPAATRYSGPVEREASLVRTSCSRPWRTVYVPAGFEYIWWTRV